MLRKILLVGILLLSGSCIKANGQQLRDVFCTVEQALVIIRTEEKALAPTSTGGMASANGLGSGVLISIDGKILTAAHLVHAADATMVEYSKGDLARSLNVSQPAALLVQRVAAQSPAARRNPRRLGASEYRRRRSGTGRGYHPVDQWTAV
jgi:hypothetical protein